MSEFSYEFSNGIPCCEPDKKCCFKNIWGTCTILKDCNFYDKKCHFRKLALRGENQYEKERKAEIKDKALQKA